MKIKFCGGINCVTGSCTHLSYEPTCVQFLVDCGMVQGGINQDADNAKAFPFDPSSLRYVLLTHAHLDHCGLIPRLYKEGFVGNVICTEATACLTREVLLDSAKINNNSRLYSESDVNRIKYHHLDALDDFAWGTQYRLDDDLKVYALRSSHILGACGFGIMWKKEEDWKSIFL